MRKSALICISGPDGVGKTTQARLLEKRLVRRGIPVKYIWMRWNHKLSLPVLAMAKLLKLREVERFQGGKIAYYYLNKVKPIAMLYGYTLLIDTMLSILFKAYIKLWMGKFVICDRYIYDIIVDLMVSTRNSKLLSSLVGRLFLSLANKPVVMLIARPSVLKSRREDVSKDKDLELRIKHYKILSALLKIKTVDAEKPIAEVHLAIMKVVEDFYGF